MDEKLRKLQQKHKSQALASQLEEEGEDLATALNHDPFETELNEIRGMTQSILEAQSPPKQTDEQGSRIREGSLVHLENMLEQQIGDDQVMDYRPFEGSIVDFNADEYAEAPEDLGCQIRSRKASVFGEHSRFLSGDFEAYDTGAVLGPLCEVGTQTEAAHVHQSAQTDEKEVSVAIVQTTVQKTQEIEVQTAQLVTRSFECQVRPQTKDAATLPTFEVLDSYISTTDSPPRKNSII